jgi:hypothetical protein
MAIHCSVLYHGNTLFCSIQWQPGDRCFKQIFHPNDIRIQRSILFFLKLLKLKKKVKQKERKKEKKNSFFFIKIQS